MLFCRQSTRCYATSDSGLIYAYTDADYWRKKGRIGKYNSIERFLEEERGRACCPETATNLPTEKSAALSFSIFQQQSQLQRGLLLTRKSKPLEFFLFENK